MTGLPLRSDVQSIAAKRGLIPSSGSNANVLITPWSYWHRRDVPVAGQTNYTFFNEPASLGITNLDNQGQIPANQVFEVHGMSFHFLPGFDRVGQRAGIATGSLTQALIESSILNRSAVIASSLDPAAPLALWPEKSRELLEQGQVKFTVSSRTLLNQYGLTQFPAGRGVLSESNQALSATFTAAAGISTVRQNVFNGAPFNANVERFASKVGIFPGQAFGVTVDYNRSVDFTQQYAGPLYNITGTPVVAGVLTCELFGVLITTLS